MLEAHTSANKMCKEFIENQKSKFQNYYFIHTDRGQWGGGGGGIMYIIKLSEGSVTVAVPIEIRTRNYSHSN